MSTKPLRDTERTPNPRVMAAMIIKHAQECPHDEVRYAQLVHTRDKIRAALSGCTMAEQYKALLFMVYELDKKYEETLRG